MTATVAPSAVGDIYTAISYDSRPFAQSDPARLLGLARMHGLTVPDLARARVLELGCASGANLVPLAARLPGARFLGIDLAPRHVAEARARIASAGLANVEVRQADITTFDTGGERFDAVICHGVYSWVPPETRRAILRIVSDCLSETGVAYVSYNVLPGWHVRGPIRELMRLHAGSERERGLAERIARARAVIASLAAMMPADTLLGDKLREEAAGAAIRSDAYVLGEFLAPFNAPCRFHELATAAAGAGLAFLCEADPETSVPETHGEETARLVHTLVAGRPERTEQWIDLCIGRQFRQTLLVRERHARAIARPPDPRHILALPVHGRLLHVSDEDDRFVYRSAANRTFEARSLAVHYAVEQLAAAFPETRTVEELSAGVGELGVTVGPGERAEIAAAVLDMLRGGLVRPSSVPVRVGRADAERPVAFTLARSDAAAGRRETTSLLHEPVGFGGVEAALLPLLDGTRDRAELCRALQGTIDRGPIDGSEPGGSADDLVAQALQRLAEAALLMP